jgi:hypothetical protein
LIARFLITGDVYRLFRDKNSKFYQLKIHGVTVVQHAIFQAIERSRTWKAVPFTSTLQVKRSGRNVITEYMDDNLEGIRAIPILSEKACKQRIKHLSNTIGNSSRWKLVNRLKLVLPLNCLCYLILVKPSLPFENTQFTIYIRPDQRQVISFNVTGKPAPTLTVTKNGDYSR